MNKISNESLIDLISYREELYRILDVFMMNLERAIESSDNKESKEDLEKINTAYDIMENALYQIYEDNGIELDEVISRLKSNTLDKSISRNIFKHALKEISVLEEFFGELPDNPERLLDHSIFLPINLTLQNIKSIDVYKYRDKQWLENVNKEVQKIKNKLVNTLNIE